jgi:hypothetical protein
VESADRYLALVKRSSQLSHMKPQALYRLLVLGGVALAMTQCLPPSVQPGEEHVTQVTLPDGGTAWVLDDGGVGQEPSAGGGVPGW